MYACSKPVKMLNSIRGNRQNKRCDDKQNRDDNFFAQNIAEEPEGQGEGPGNF